MSTGYVGIGTTTPSSPLEVNGNITITKNSGGSLIFQDGTTQSTAGSVTGITAASGSGLTVTSGTSTPVIGTDPTVLQMRINAACGPGAYMTSVNSAGGINCSGVVSNPGTVTNVSAISGSGLTVANATSTPQINTDFTVLQKRVAAGCPSGQFLQSIAIDGTPSCLPVYSAAPSGFTTLGASPVPPAGYSVSASVAINGRNPWSQTASLNTARYGHGVVAIGSSIFAVGGFAPGYLSSLERYNTSGLTLTWSTVTPSGGTFTARSNSAVATSTAAISTGAMYVFGGYTAAGVSSLVDMYNPATYTWTSKPSLRAQGLAGACAASDTAGNIYILGGFDSAVSPTVTRYDPVRAIYKSLPQCPLA